MKTAEGHLLNEAGTNYDKDAYEKASNTVDICICTIMDDKLQVLLIKRKFPPFKDRWAIPGGFLDIKKKEGLNTCALRELEEETCVKGIPVYQLGTYGEPDRDPRMRVITTAYYALVPESLLPFESIEAKDDAKEYDWFPIKKLPEMAFDHDEILMHLNTRIQNDIMYTSKSFELVDKKFTWAALQKVYEAVLGGKILPPNFRRKIKIRYKIKTTKKTAKIGRGRSPALLQFKGIKKPF